MQLWIIGVDILVWDISLQTKGEIPKKKRLDPPLLSVQRKRTAHERAKELFASGEFSSGRKWADDAPKERLDTNTVNLIASGACGAFVHGLEDEMFGTGALYFVSFCQIRVLHT